MCDTAGGGVTTTSSCGSAGVTVRCTKGKADSGFPGAAFAIIKRDTDGSFAGDFGSSGTGNGQFNGPSGIAADATQTAGWSLEALTDALRMELHATPIHVSLIEPGPVTTDFRRNAARAFARHVDWRASPHRPAYEATLMARLNATDGPPDRFELPPAAVTARLSGARPYCCGFW